MTRYLPINWAHGSGKADWTAGSAWSRNGKDSRYVQDLLRSHAEEVRQWVERGAAIYGCGSLNGMGRRASDAAGHMAEAKVAELLGSGRYRRDVY
jgi:sulfite reductase (NADPH) flavoprotein alpha-component